MNDNEVFKPFQMVGVVVACLVKRDGKYLFVQERQEQAYGLWNLPAGHVDEGESITDAAVREVAEETGYKVELGPQIALIHEGAANAVKHVFLAEIIGGEIVDSSDEIMKVEWLTFEDIERLNQEGKIRKPWVWDVVCDNR